MSAAAWPRLAPARLPRLRWVGLLVLFALTFAGAEALKPRQFWADELGNPVYARLLPDHFGDWHQVPSPGNMVVNPVQAEMLDRIYSETVSRVYRHATTGRQLMLSVAYGRDQSTDTQLHTPEMCYPSQGFRVDATQEGEVTWSGGRVPVRQLHTTMGRRIEPLTYFVRTGDRITTRGSLPRNLARLSVAARGYKVDGLLVRVSEVTQAPDALAVQADFLRQLVEAMPPADRAKLIGQPDTTPR